MASRPTSNPGATDRNASGWVLVDALVALLVVATALVSLALAVATYSRAARIAWDRVVRGIEERNAAIALYVALPPRD